MCPKKKTSIFADAKRTDIIFTEDLIINADKYICPLIKNIHVKHFLITDQNVDALYSEDIMSQFDNKIQLIKIVIEANEASKSFEVYLEVINKILDEGIDKESTIISLGGGIVNNLAGYIASTIYRGVPLIHIPTSLLAQVDAAIDFKQAINYNSKKNIIGSIYPPKMILIDPNVLETLPLSEINNGFAEIIKHALTQSRIITDKLICDNLNKNQISELIQEIIDFKVDLINNKPENADMIMQYGHLVGHSLENITSYKLKHGEAISIGMCISAEISYLKGSLNKQDLEIHYSLMRKFNLPIILPSDITIDRIWTIMKQDKYANSGTPICGLLSSIGELEYVNNSFEIPLTKLEVMKAIKNNRKRDHES